MILFVHGLSDVNPKVKIYPISSSGSINSLLGFELTTAGTSPLPSRPLARSAIVLNVMLPQVAYGSFRFKDVQFA